MKTVKWMILWATLALLVPFVASPASAATPRNCALKLVPIGTGTRHGVVEARLVRLGCFRTFAEAIRVGSGGAIRVPAGTTPASLTQPTLDRSTQLSGANVLIGTEYDLLAYAGNSSSYYAANTCAGVTWEVANVGSAVNDTFESGKGYGGCDHNKKFQDINFGGTVITCTPNCSDYGVLRDKVSSLKWKP